MDDQFNLEKFKISERLGSVEITLATLVEQVKTVLTNMARYDHELYGNGSPGLKTTVDRLEQVQLARRGHLKFIWGALGSLFVKVGFDFFAKK